MGEKLPLIARAIGGKVIGPRPGKAIISFWQGIVEIILRAVVTLIGFLALVCAAIAVSSDVQDDVGLKNAASGAVLVVALFSGVIEVALISLRFLNVGAINYKIKYFLIADAIMSSVLSFLFLGGAGIAIFGASKWSGTLVSHTLAAAAALCVFVAIFLWVLGVWSVVFMVQKWNKHVVTYTLKDAVLG